MAKAKSELKRGERRALTRRLLTYMTRHRLTVVLAFGAMILAGITEAVPIGLSKMFVEDVLLATPAARTGDLDRKGGRDVVLLTDSGPTIWHHDAATGVFVRGSTSEATKAWNKPRGSWSLTLVRKMQPMLPDGVERNMAVLVLVVGLILLTSLLAAVATYGNEYIAKALATHVVADMRCEMLDRVLRLPLGYFTRRKMGDLQSRFSNDAQTVHLCVNLFVSELLLQPFIMVAGVAAALVINWRLAIAAFLFLPGIVYPIVRIGRQVQQRTKRMLETMSDTTESVSQALSGIRIVKAFSMEDRESADFRALNHVYRERNLSIVRAKARAKAIIDVTYGLVLAMSLGGGGWLVINGQWDVEAGDFVAFLVALATMFRPIKRLTTAFHSWNESLAGAKRLFEVIDSEREVSDRTGAHMLGTIRGGVTFDRVNFHYPDTPEQTVLEQITFGIPAGGMVALVGPSGAGKSTIADLLLRFYEPSSGRILIDGVPLDNISRHSLLRQIAVVSQQPFLFNATIRQNIRYGRPTATDDEVIAAAKAAHVHEFATALADGYDTVVGERGASLSGGQLQRITIARAILKDASLLILDEATSNLDSRSEQLVQEALHNLLKGRTALVIAHRLSTIERADTIVVLDQGRILEAGSHAELISRRGAYFALHRNQLAPAEAG